MDTLTESAIETKVCTQCLEALPSDVFYLHWSKPNQNHFLSAACKPCTLERQRVRAKNFPEQAREIKRRSGRKHRYGIDGVSYDQMFAKQNGLCAICNEPETMRNAAGTVWDLSVDHDHLTKKVRGLLCDSCNKTIAYAKENIQVLEAAIQYLKVASSTLEGRD